MMSALAKRKGSRGETGSGRSRQGEKDDAESSFFVFIKKLAEIFSYRPERSKAGVYSSFAEESSCTKPSVNPFFSI